jgi:hypothetical protein
MKKLILTLALFYGSFFVRAQENYEIQVYGSPTMDKGTTMIELHSNFTFKGEKEILKNVRPSYHALHETLEITQGITNNFELGFYLFTNYTPGYGYRVIGTHIRPRISAPEKWKLPVGLSLSAEFGKQSNLYSDEYWSVELRPILDKQINKLYVSFNPTLDFQLKGATKKTAPAFAPNIKIAYAVTSKISLGTEYYGDMGAINHFENGLQQSHTLFIAADLFVNPLWEINFGPGFGLTPATDPLIVKLIIGRHLVPGRHHHS